MELEKKKRIGIDLDDTVWELHRGFLNFCNMKYNKNFTINDCVRYRSLEDIFEISGSEILKLIDEFELLEENKILPFLENVEEFILELDKKYEIHFITARSSKDRELVSLRLFEIFGKEMPVFFQYDENRNKIFEKVELCLEKEIEMMIDDGYHNLVDCSKNGIKCFLVNYPWNEREKLLENMKRVNNWREIVE